MVGSKQQRLPRSFYERSTLEVAPELLGKHLVYRSPSGVLSVRIVEVEAYIGTDDPACHASCGLTERTKPMFGSGGFSYIYFIYGMYHCLNVVTEKQGVPAAVLIRAAEPVEGVDLMSRPAGKSSSPVRLLSGPGKLCRALGLTREHNELDLTGDSLFLIDHGASPTNIASSPRIGIRVARDRLWRFCDGDSPALSRPAVPPAGTAKL